MQDDTRRALVDSLSGYHSLVEIGIGRRTAVARALAARGASVTATDIAERAVPDGVTFALDDVTDPSLDVYEGAEALYALNLPPELHRPAADVAANVGAVFLFTTLGGDQPTIPVTRETLPDETLYRGRRGR